MLLPVIESMWARWNNSLFRYKAASHVKRATGKTRGRVVPSRGAVLEVALQNAQHNALTHALASL